MTIEMIAGMSWRRITLHPQCRDDDVDELDADERRDHPAGAVDEQVAAQQRATRSSG